MMKMPALAVVGPDRRIIRSTESFRRRYEHAEALCEQSPEIDRVLTGDADVARATLGNLKVEIEAVTDATGKRQVMLTLPPDDPASEPETPLAALRAAADDSPAIVWVKDLDGRYLYANHRYVSDFETSDERLYGNTDSDLPEAETVDGPRLRYAEDGLEEPLQLEYTVPALDKRPALAAFRFPLRDDAGHAIATCGVAAPSGEAQVARDEAVRLMQLERWNRLDPVDVRAEVLEQWHVQAAPARSEESETGEAPAPAPVPAEPRHVEAAEPEATHAIAQVEPEPPAPEPEPRLEREQVEKTSRPSEPIAAPTAAPPPASTSVPAGPSLSDTAELLQTNLQLARKWADRAEQLQDELQDAQVRARQAEGEIQHALAAAARAVEDADRWRAELDQTRLELDQARVELEQAQDEVHGARSEAEAARSELGAVRAHAEALRGPSTVALRLSEDLGRAVAVERDRGDELERTLTRLRARLADFETALEHNPATPKAVEH